MEMLLMGAVLALFGIAVSCLAFGAATRSEEDAPVAARPPQPELVKAASVPARFFEPAPAPAPAVAAASRVPIEALLLQIENHVRLEQAAAESFMAAPDAALLHSRTMSPFVN